MKRIIKNSAIVLSLILLVLVAMIFRPIMNLEPKDCGKLTGEIITLKAHQGSKDITFRVKGDQRRFYINRGLEQGLIEEELIEATTNTKSLIYYADHWTPLDPKSIVRHVAHIEVDGTALFSEFKENPTLSSTYP
ncbi:hypothetical protein GCM10009117_14020 [Gangjinia marincola]|uniref:Uncharacterized protein n=1 Tax=Gangjinia marincola TaxID=578463 RepID=A0ABP3XS45_9FLAO